MFAGTSLRERLRFGAPCAASTWLGRVGSLLGRYHHWRRAASSFPVAIAVERSVEIEKRHPRLAPEARLAADAARRLAGHPVAETTQHGDLTLGNVLVSANDRVALIDPMTGGAPTMPPGSSPSSGWGEASCSPSGCGGVTRSATPGSGPSSWGTAGWMLLGTRLRMWSRGAARRIMLATGGWAGRLPVPSRRHRSSRGERRSGGTSPLSRSRAMNSIHPRRLTGRTMRRS